MANHKSAEKRIRQTTKRTAVNRKRISIIRASLKKVELAIAAGNQKAAKQALLEAQPKLMSGVSKGGRILLSVQTRFMREWVNSHNGEDIRTLWQQEQAAEGYVIEIMVPQTPEAVAVAKPAEVPSTVITAATWQSSESTEPDVHL